jgi:TRAP-type C4-dicarboxylate transport system substrate-binding protein
LQHAMRAAIAHAVEFQRELAIEEDRTARAAILAEGCEITELTADQHAQFRAAVAPLLAQARGTYGQAMFDMI